LAENEKLDINISPRWQRVCRAFRQGESQVEMEQRMRRNLHAFVRRSIRNIAAKGVRLGEMLHVASACPGELPELLRRCRQHDFACLIADNAEPEITKEELLQRTMNALWNRLADQIACELVPCTAWPNFTDCYERLDQLRNSVQADLERIANRLAQDPEWEPRVPPRRRVAAQVEASLFDGSPRNEATATQDDPANEDIRAFLGESLLNHTAER
jgi:hypothetical protein